MVPCQTYRPLLHQPSIQLNPKGRIFIKVLAALCKLRTTSAIHKHVHLGPVKNNPISTFHLASWGDGNLSTRICQPAAVTLGAPPKNNKKMMAYHDTRWRHRLIYRLHPAKGSFVVCSSPIWERFGRVRFPLYRRVQFPNLSKRGIPAIECPGVALTLV